MKNLFRNSNLDKNSRNKNKLKFNYGKLSES